MMLPPFLKKILTPHVIGVLVAVGIAALIYAGIVVFGGSADPIEMSQTDGGRRELSEQLHLREEVWLQLLTEIHSQRTKDYQTEMSEGSTRFQVRAFVPVRDGPPELTVQGIRPEDAAIVMIDADRDQEPETIRILKTIDGKADVRELMVKDLQPEDASQFLLAWSLAWGQIAEEFQAIGQNQAEQQVNVQFETIPGN